MRISVLPVFLFLACRAVAGKAAPTATQGIRLQSYALGSYTTPTVFGYPGASAVTVGANLNPFHFGHLQPGVDARASVDFGTQREFFFGGGPRLQFDFHRFHPYADYLFGYGSLHFNSGNPAYTHDNALVTSPGGGLDVSLHRGWALRLDVQGQTWLMGGPERFSSTAVGVGLRYQFHFRNHNGLE